MGKHGDAGSHSTAFEARQAGLDRSVELRILNRRMGEDEPSYHRFQREFRVLANLDHPALISVLDLGVADGRVYYTTDLRQSRSLRERLEEHKGGLDIDQVLDWLLPVGDALALMHAKGILHRDVSLDSIRVDEVTGRAYLATFAVMKILKLPSLTEKGFKAPTAGAAWSVEQGDDGTEDERTDVFQFAAVLYQCLTGRLLPTTLEVQTGRAQPSAELAPPSELRRGLANHLDGTILEGLAPDPGDRPKSMQRLLAALRRKRKLLEMKNVARSAGLPTAALPVVTREEPAAEAADGEEEPETAEVLAQSSRAAVGEVVEIARDWIQESPRNRNKALGALAACVLLTLGLQWLTSGGEAYDPGTPGPVNESRRARRPPPKVDQTSLRQKLTTTVDATIQEPTTPKTFEMRWDVLKGFVKSLPRDVRLQHFPPSVMANLRVGYYRSPEKASRDLDELLAKAAKVTQP